MKNEIYDYVIGFRALIKLTLRRSVQHSVLYSPLIIHKLTTHNYENT